MAVPEPRPDGPSGPPDVVRRDPRVESRGAAGQWFAPLAGPDSPDAGPAASGSQHPSAPADQAVTDTPSGSVPKEKWAKDLAEQNESIQKAIKSGAVDSLAAH